MKKSKQEEKNQLQSLGRKKKDEKPVSSSEVTRDLFSTVWKEHLDEVRTMAGELQSEKLASIKKHGKKILLKDTKKRVRLSLLKNK
jgi:hypothetical protein